MSASDSSVDCLLTIGAALQVVKLLQRAATKSITICRVEENISESGELYRRCNQRSCFLGGLLV